MTWKRTFRIPNEEDLVFDAPRDDVDPSEIQGQSLNCNPGYPRDQIEARGANLSAARSSSALFKLSLSLENVLGGLWGASSLLVGHGRLSDLPQPILRLPTAPALHVNNRDINTPESLEPVGPLSHHPFSPAIAHLVG
jgi:hypothetical protein